MPFNIALTGFPLNISPQQILLHWLNLVILVGGLYFILYKPVKKFISKREEYYKELEQQAGDKIAQAETQEDDSIGLKAVAAGIAVGIAAAAGALSMGLVTSKSTEGISRQPEAEGKIRSAMMLGLVFIETAIIYALLVVILIIFVL